MFLSAGQPGQLRKVQASVTAARKVFRVMRPLESITPLLMDPRLPGKQAWQVEAVAKLKDVLMAAYFAADHVVWANQIGLLPETKRGKKAGERAQKVSLWSWALGSACTVVLEAHGILQAAARQRQGESDGEWLARQEQARQEINARSFVLLHGCVQMATAMGLLQVLPWRPRTVGLLGTIASAMNCYLLLPAHPHNAAKLRAAAAAQGGGASAGAAGMVAAARGAARGAGEALLAAGGGDKLVAKVA
jgi:hypothetical protein